MTPGSKIDHIIRFIIIDGYSYLPILTCGSEIHTWEFIDPSETASLQVRSFQLDHNKETVTLYDAASGQYMVLWNLKIAFSTKVYRDDYIFEVLTITSLQSHIPVPT